MSSGVYPLRARLHSGHRRCATRWPSTWSPPCEERTTAPDSQMRKRRLLGDRQGICQTGQRRRGQNSILLYCRAGTRRQGFPRSKAKLGRPQCHGPSCPRSCTARARVLHSGAQSPNAARGDSWRPALLAAGSRPSPPLPTAIQTLVSRGRSRELAQL